LFLVFAVAPSSSAQTPLSDRETAGLAAEQAGRLREAFDDYVAALQALPDHPPLDVDQRLRERIIRLAWKLDPPPAVPEEAQQRITSAQMKSKSAQTREEVIAAASEFERALRLAPWFAGGYFSLGEWLEKLKLYPAAIRSFELYLLAAPAAQDAESVRNKISGLRCRFDATYLKHTSFWAHMDPTWTFGDGDLAVCGGSIQFSGSDAFNFPISDVRSLERKRGPARLPYLRIVLRNGKKFDLFIGSGEEDMAAVEKAIKDMA
jgi:tetratricopeptide (TPR) repeat protein